MRVNPRGMRIRCGEHQISPPNLNKPSDPAANCSLQRASLLNHCLSLVNDDCLQNSGFVPSRLGTHAQTAPSCGAAPDTGASHCRGAATARAGARCVCLPGERLLCTRPSQQRLQRALATACNSINRVPIVCASAQAMPRQWGLATRASPFLCSF